MISEKAFATYFATTWRSFAPTMDLLIRKINRELYEREFPILVSKVEPRRRGLINEIAFNIFSRSPEWHLRRDWNEEVEKIAIHEAKKKIALLENLTAEQLSEPSKIELEDCAQQVERFRTFFRGFPSQYFEFHPRFPGAGIIDECEGDIYFKDTLFEVKAGERPVRSTDLKQLLIYSTLAHASGVRSIKDIGIFNPRTGISFKASLDFICSEISGASSFEVMSEIMRVISSGDISR